MTKNQQRHSVLARHYAGGHGPIAFLDESYEVSGLHGLRFYLMAAVIVERSQMVPLRAGLDELVTSGWWHTTDELLSAAGRAKALELLEFLVDGREQCVIAHVAPLAEDDGDGEVGRALALTVMLATFGVMLTPKGGRCAWLCLRSAVTSSNKGGTSAPGPTQ